ncbi:hypothetical protein E2C01_070126 [Portunus trituberculatus]|uniref:Uncharacterized protein n=1 Tax=Portunus trituberculatus TaxID=210409 RepID=A0A5B7HWG6_PORTR|nr:hypothetical protein [Portunus trituberculatus]
MYPTPLHFLPAPISLFPPCASLRTSPSYTQDEQRTGTSHKSLLTKFGIWSPHLGSSQAKLSESPHQAAPSPLAKPAPLPDWPLHPLLSFTLRPALPSPAPPLEASPSIPLPLPQEVSPTPNHPPPVATHLTAISSPQRPQPIPGTKVHHNS